MADRMMADSMIVNLYYTELDRAARFWRDGLGGCGGNPGVRGPTVRGPWAHGFPLYVRRSGSC